MANYGNRFSGQIHCAAAADRHQQLIVQRNETLGLSCLEQVVKRCRQRKKNHLQSSGAERTLDFIRQKPLGVDTAREKLKSQDDSHTGQKTEAGNFYNGDWQRIHLSPIPFRRLSCLLTQGLVKGNVAPSACRYFRQLSCFGCALFGFTQKFS